MNIEEMTKHLVEAQRISLEDNNVGKDMRILLKREATTENMIKVLENISSYYNNLKNKQEE